MAPRRRRWFLREWREHRKLSQEALGHMIGVTQGMISQLELGTTDYTRSYLEKLSEALKCSIYDLLFRDPNWPESPTSVFEELNDADKPLAIDMLKAIKARRAG